jgi:hypothetical protein
MCWEVGSTLKQAYSPVKGSAMCVQRLDDSRSAVRITYRISLRSSSSQEPRYPLLKVVAIKYLGGQEGSYAFFNTRNFPIGKFMCVFAMYMMAWGVETMDMLNTEIESVQWKRVIYT